MGRNGQQDRLSRYVSGHWLSVAFVFGLFAAFIGVRLLSGTGKVHVFVPTQATATVDGAPLPLKPSRRHQVVELSRGRHRVALTVDGQTSEQEVEVSLFKEFLLPTRGQCFAWLLRGKPPRITARYDDHAPIEVPAGTQIGADEINATIVEPAAVFADFDCQLMTRTDEELLRAL
jgi:hypothetical protein